MSERQGSETAIPNSGTADLSTLPLRAARLGRAAGSVQPSSLICSRFVGSPLPSVGAWLTGWWKVLLSGGGGPPTAGGHEQHWETQGKKMALVILV